MPTSVLATMYVSIARLSLLPIRNGKDLDQESLSLLVVAGETLEADPDKCIIYVVLLGALVPIGYPQDCARYCKRSQC